MYRDGYKHMVNTDYSEVVIDNMRAKTVSMKEMTWEVMDIFNMTYDDNSFDVILEKGTLDAFLVGEKDPWRMSAGGLAQMDTICKSVSINVPLCTAVDKPKFMASPPDHPWWKNGLAESAFGCPNYFDLSLKEIYF